MAHFNYSKKDFYDNCIDFDDYSDHLSIWKWFWVFMWLVFQNSKKDDFDKLNKTWNFMELRKMMIIDCDFDCWIWLIFVFIGYFYDQFLSFILTRSGVKVLVKSYTCFYWWDWALFCYFLNVNFNVRIDWICLIKLA